MMISSISSKFGMSWIRLLLGILIIVFSSISGGFGLWVIMVSSISRDFGIS